MVWFGEIETNSQIIKDYIYLLFFLLIIICCTNCFVLWSVHVSIGEPLRLRQRDQVLQIQGGGDQYHARQAQPLPAGLQSPIINFPKLRFYESIHLIYCRV